jgi:hypothetical protein
VDGDFDFLHEKSPFWFLVQKWLYACHSERSKESPLRRGRSFATLRMTVRIFKIARPLAALTGEKGVKG